MGLIQSYVCLESRYSGTLIIGVFLPKMPHEKGIYIYEIYTFENKL